MITLYLDENIPPLVARILQDERYDVVSAHEVGMAGKPDDEQLRYASQLTSSFALFSLFTDPLFNQGDVFRSIWQQINAKMS